MTTEIQESEIEINTARTDGYDAGFDFHMCFMERKPNPYDEDRQPGQYSAWEQGFDDAGMDS